MFVSFDYVSQVVFWCIQNCYQCDLQAVLYVIASFEMKTQEELNTLAEIALEGGLSNIDSELTRLVQYYLTGCDVKNEWSTLASRWKLASAICTAEQNLLHAVAPNTGYANVTYSLSEGTTVTWLAKVARPALFTSERIHSMLAKRSEAFTEASPMQKRTLRSAPLLEQTSVKTTEVVKTYATVAKTMVSPVKSAAADETKLVASIAAAISASGLVLSREDLEKVASKAASEVIKRSQLASTPSRALGGGGGAALCV